MKICNSCKVEKSLTMFGWQKTAKDGLCPTCRECRKEQGRKHRARSSAYEKSYRAERKEHTVKTMKDYYDKNRDKIDADKSEWGQLNRDRLREKEREYRTTEKGKAVQRLKQFRRDKRISDTDDGTITAEALIELLVVQDDKCKHCGKELDHHTSRAVQLDHLVPLSKGGQHTISNVGWSCAICNLKKSNKII